MEKYNLSDLWLSYRELKNTNFSQKSFEEIEKAFAKKFKGIFMISQEIDGELPNLTVHRAVINNEKNDSIDRISYPPSNITRLNRANIKGVPVFYCSEHAPTSISEIDPREGDTIYLGIWEGNNLTQLPIVPYLTNYEGQLPHLKTLKQKIHDTIEKVEFFDASYEYKKLYYEILTELFLDDNLYLSSFIAHTLLYEKKATEIFIYPSVKNNRDFTNFAIHKDIIDNKKLNLAKVIRFKCEGGLDSEGFPKLVGRNEIGIPSGNKISWMEVSQESYLTFIRPLMLVLDEETV